MVNTLFLTHGCGLLWVVVSTCCNIPLALTIMTRLLCGKTNEIDILPQAPQNISAALLVYNQCYRGNIDIYKRFLPAFRPCETFPMLTLFNLTFHSRFALNLHLCNISSLLIKLLVYLTSRFHPWDALKRRAFDYCCKWVGIWICVTLFVQIMHFFVNNENFRQ